jgi:hypothetical protein
MIGTVVRVERTSVFVQWHNVAVEDEMDSGELVSTGRFQKRVQHHARVLDGSEDGELVAFYDEDEKECRRRRLRSVGSPDLPASAVRKRMHAMFTIMEHGAESVCCDCAVDGGIRPHRRPILLR